MNTEVTQASDAPRTNRHGDTCPDWCTVNHERIDVHESDYVATVESFSGPRVRLTKDGTDPLGREWIWMAMDSATFMVEPREADRLAGLLEALAGQPATVLLALADEVRQAGRIA